MNIQLNELTRQHVLMAKHVFLYVRDGREIMVRRWHGSTSAKTVPLALEDLLVEVSADALDPVSMLQAALEYLGFEVDPNPAALH